MPGNDEHFELYWREFARWCRPDELARILKCGSPDELEALLKSSLEHQKEDNEFREHLRTIIQERRDRTQLRRAFGQFWTIIWKVGAGALAVIAGLNSLPPFLSWLKEILQ